jgi:UDP-N-acetylglucosamine--dolichyl-phosphate N-acetylglucosaminephosphotransferase
MAFLSIFCTNTINILAGVNGIEAGQSIVIAICIAINDMLYVMKPGHPAIDAHLFSLYFLVPFIGVSLALLYHNWYVVHFLC